MTPHLPDAAVLHPAPDDAVPFRYSSTGSSALSSSTFQMQQYCIQHLMTPYLFRYSSTAPSAPSRRTFKVQQYCIQRLGGQTETRPCPIFSTVAGSNSIQQEATTLVEKHDLDNTSYVVWRAAMPRIVPFYAVKIPLLALLSLRHVAIGQVDVDAAARDTEM
eukprot:gene8078-1320_t